MKYFIFDMILAVVLSVLILIVGLRIATTLKQIESPNWEEIVSEYDEV